MKHSKLSETIAPQTRKASKTFQESSDENASNLNHKLQPNTSVASSYLNVTRKHCLMYWTCSTNVLKKVRQNRSKHNTQPLVRKNMHPSQTVLRFSVTWQRHIQPKSSKPQGKGISMAWKMMASYKHLQWQRRSHKTIHKELNNSKPFDSFAHNQFNWWGIAARGWKTKASRKLILRLRAWRRQHQKPWTLSSLPAYELTPRKCWNRPKAAVRPKRFKQGSPTHNTQKKLWTKNLDSTRTHNILWKNYKVDKQRLQFAYYRSVKTYDMSDPHIIVFRALQIIKAAVLVSVWQRQLPKIYPQRYSTMLKTQRAITCMNKTNHSTLMPPAGRFWKSMLMAYTWHTFKKERILSCDNQLY